MEKHPLKASPKSQLPRDTFSAGWAALGGVGRRCVNLDDELLAIGIIQTSLPEAQPHGVMHKSYDTLFVHFLDGLRQEIQAAGSEISSEHLISQSQAIARSRVMILHLSMTLKPRSFDRFDCRGTVPGLI